MSISLTEILEHISRVHLAQLPTPVQELKRLSVDLAGPRILIKRDDQTGLAFGGNKTRKLEFLIADALACGADTVITAGASQSNHCRQTAAAAAHVGLRCILVLGGIEPQAQTGNLLLDNLLGAEIHWTGRERRGERMEEIAEASRRKGHNPYIIPYGGSNAKGAIGYVVAMIEFLEQVSREGRAVDSIVFASSSGGTQAGLVVGAKLGGYEGKIIGVSVDKGERGDLPYELELAKLGTEVAHEIGTSMDLTEADFTVDFRYLGGGYGVVGALERKAIRLLATTEGILLDPVYTARAFGGMIDMIKKGVFEPDETVLFWHTGGAPALFGYAREL